MFNPCEQDSKTYGAEIFDNPTGDPEISETEHGFSLRKALRADLDWICDKADAIAMLPGWERSYGARTEHALAVALKLQFIYLDEPAVPRRQPKR